MFARLVVAKPTWQDFRALAATRDITVARYVGRLVEECPSSTASASPDGG
jgi:hypothetical protein